jgi:hypothetical protein
MRFLAPGLLFTLRSHNYNTTKINVLIGVRHEIFPYCLTTFVCQGGRFFFVSGGRFLVCQGDGSFDTLGALGVSKEPSPWHKKEPSPWHKRE